MTNGSAGSWHVIKARSPPPHPRPVT